MSGEPAAPAAQPPALAGASRHLLPAGVNVVGAAAAIGLAALLSGAFVSGQMQLAAVVLAFIALVLVLTKDAALGLMLWAVMAPFYRFFVLDMGSGLPNLGLNRVVALSLILLLFAQRAAGRRWLARLTAVEGLAALFVMGLLLSVPASHLGLLNGFQNVFDFAVLPMLWLYFGRTIFGNQQGVSRLAGAIAIAGAVIGIIAAREQLTRQMVLSPYSAHSVYGQYSVKLNSLFGAVASMSMTLAMTVPAAYVSAMRARTLWRRLAWSVVLGAILAGLALTYMRAGWVAALVCLVLPTFFSRRAQHYALRLAPAAVILVLIFLSGYGGVDTRSFEERAQSQRPIDYRLEALQVGLRIVARSQVFGLGLDNYSEAAIASGWRPLGAVGLPAGAAHNMYIYVLTSAGLVGLLPLLGLLGLIGWRTLKALRMLRMSDDRDWPAVALGLIVGYAGITFTFDALSAQLANMYFFVFVGAVLGAYEVGYARTTVRAHRAGEEAL